MPHAQGAGCNGLQPHGAGEGAAAGEGQPPPGRGGGGEARYYETRPQGPLEGDSALCGVP